MLGSRCRCLSLQANVQLIQVQTHAFRLEEFFGTSLIAGAQCGGEWNPAGRIGEEQRTQPRKILGSYHQRQRTCGFAANGDGLAVCGDEQRWKQAFPAPAICTITQAAARCRASACTKADRMWSLPTKKFWLFLARVSSDCRYMVQSVRGIAESLQDGGAQQHG